MKSSKIETIRFVVVVVVVVVVVALFILPHLLYLLKITDDEGRGSQP